jgi:hypothetical protein
MDDERIFCKCGCGKNWDEPVKGRGVRKKYFSKDCYPKPELHPFIPVQTLCECGCGRSFLKDSHKRRFFEKQCGINKRISDLQQDYPVGPVERSVRETSYNPTLPRNDHALAALMNRSMPDRKDIVWRMMDCNYTFDDIAKELNRGNFRPIGHPKQRYNGKVVMAEVASGFGVPDGCR